MSLFTEIIFGLRQPLNAEHKQLLSQMHIVCKIVILEANLLCKKATGEAKPRCFATRKP